MKKSFYNWRGGYCGTRLVPQLLKVGYKVVVYDKFYFGNFLPKQNKNLKIINGDIRNTKIIQFM